MTSRAEHIARWSGACIILFSALARVLTSPSRIPYWDIDPVTSWAPDTTRTPAMSLLLDALVWLAASAIIWAEGRAGRGIAWKTGLLALIGCVGVALHGWVLTPLTAIGGSPPTHGDFQSMSLGSAWASAIVGAWALSMAARDAAIKRTAAATLFGVVIVLAAKGAMQVFIDHPRLVAEFNARKDEMLATQGFQPGSVNARLFERRLVQSEATGWFGLSNVYGSIMAAGTAAFLSLAIGATRAARAAKDADCIADQRRPVSSSEAALLWLATLTASTGLALSQSKGAIVAGFVGGLLVLTLSFSQRKHKLRIPSLALRHAPLLFPLLALSAVILRGFLGERIDELSLYFRWQYLLGAARTILAHPIFGTGPAGFKDQYLLFKEPTNPEEIESPHCLPMDWLATLGLFGAVWLILWITWLSRAGATTSGADRGESESAPATTDTFRTFTPLTVAISMVVGSSLAFSFWAEWAMYLPESLIIMIFAGLAWWLIARVTAQVATNDLALRISLFASATVLATHSMIEITGVLSGSCAFTFLTVALASAARAPSASPRANRPLLAAPILPAVIAALVAATSIRLFRWESHLHAAALRASSAARDPSALCNASDAQGTALARLHAAMGIEPRTLDLPDLSARLRILQSTCPGLSEPRRLQMIDAALTVLRGTVERFPRSLAARSRLASALEIAPATASESNPALSALEHWRKAAELHPSGLTPILHSARLLYAARDPAQASNAARRALEINQSLHLDPLKQLTDPERMEMERLAAAELLDPTSIPLPAPGAAPTSPP